LKRNKPRRPGRLTSKGGLMSPHEGSFTQSRRGQMRRNSSCSFSVFTVERFGPRDHALPQAIVRTGHHLVVLHHALPHDLGWELRNPYGPFRIGASQPTELSMAPGPIKPAGARYKKEETPRRGGPPPLELIQHLMWGGPWVWTRTPKAGMGSEIGKDAPCRVR